MTAYRCALVTGASSGIGAAFVRALPKATGLLLTGRDGEALAAVAADAAAPGRPVTVVTADLAASDGRARVVEAVRAQPIDLLINNAGLGLFGPFAEQDPARLQAMLAVNVLAPALLTRALLPGMLAEARASGRRCGLVFTASVAAFAPLPWFSAYAASKAFDDFLAAGLADELRNEPVDVLSLRPGTTRTRFFARADAATFGRAPASSPEAVAEAALAALGRRSSVTPGLHNRLYGLAVDLLPGPLLRATVRAAMQRRLGR